MKIEILQKKLSIFIFILILIIFKRILTDIEFWKLHANYGSIDTLEKLRII